MTETIGKVKLILDQYPGEDFYSDGAVEDELLSIARDCSVVEYQKIIEERKSWPILYHLSSLRENIVEYLPIIKKDKVLEVGSGCGAITGALADKAGAVTCVDLSKKRSMVNAYRHMDSDNISIHVGNFKDIEPTLASDYDYICLIGVFEYGRGYIGGDHPYRDFLNILKKHLAPGGRIVIAIENKYGMKYFAGATEDHLGSYFGGIENYHQEGSARTFSRKGLEKIFEECELKESHFYYPYPDYKFMTTLYSDQRLPGIGELTNNLRNFDRDRMQLFDEKAAFDGVLEEGLFPVFSNSYVVVLGPKLDVIYSRYSNDRAEEFRIKTQMHTMENGQIVVRKYPASKESFLHIEQMEKAYESLCERFEGSNLQINKCTLKKQEEVPYAEFEFVKGRPLSEIMDECLEKDHMDEFYQYFRQYLDVISYRKEVEVTDYDLIFSNFLVDGDTWTLIDYEWTFAKATDPKELAFRAIYCYLLEDEKRNKLDLSRIFEILEITEKEAESYRQREGEFQHYVDGGRVSMAVMRDLIGRRVLEPGKYLQKQIRDEDFRRVQIYEDEGNGYSEDRSYFLKDCYVDENRLEVTIQVSGNVHMLRVDPAMDGGVCNILHMEFNGEIVDLHQSKLVIVNGKLIKEKDETGHPYLTAIFPNNDPNINFALEKLARKGENEIRLEMEMVRLPLSMSQNLANAVKKIF